MKKEPIAGIYRFTNKLNGKAYIGQAVDIERRRRAHFYATRSGKLPKGDDNVFHRAILKYGEDVFTFDVLETFPQDDIRCDKEVLNRAETEWIKRLNTMAPVGYNTKSGGGQNVFMSQSVKNQISESHKGKYFHKKNDRDVICLETKMKYNSIAEAGRAYGISCTAVRLCCTQKIDKAGGVHWSYYENYSSELLNNYKSKKEKSNYRRPVVCIETGEFFDCANAAVLRLGLSPRCRSGIPRCCRGDRKTSGGFHWKYSDSNPLVFESLFN